MVSKTESGVFWWILAQNVLLLFYRMYENVLPNGQIKENPNVMFYCLDPHKQGITPEDYTVPPGSKGAEMNAKMMLTLDDTGHVRKDLTI